MADLDEISSGIGGLQADMRRAMEWFDRHEAADQRRFEQLADRLDVAMMQYNARLTALEINKAQVIGGWKLLSMVGTFAGALGAYLYHLIVR
jgi:hypothetical protein